MNKRLFWIGVVVGLVACGGDDSEPSTQNSTSNNATGTSNSTSTNNVEVDSGEDSATSSDDGVQADSANNSVNNSTNNTATNSNSTNNGGTPIVSGVSCMEILQCLLVCNTEDEVCRQECKDSGSPVAHEKIDDYLGCVDAKCADATGVTELTECVLAKCGEQQKACVE